jgi:hypothetical protein
LRLHVRRADDRAAWQPKEPIHGREKSKRGAETNSIDLIASKA